MGAGKVAHLSGPPLFGKWATSATPFEWPRETQFVDHSTVIGCACFLLQFIPASAGNRAVSGIPEWLKTDHPQEVIKVALAHVVRNRVEAVYARSDLFERRRV